MRFLDIDGKPRASRRANATARPTFKTPSAKPLGRPLSAFRKNRRK
jgi:hypothetical protein